MRNILHSISVWPPIPNTRILFWDITCFSQIHIFFEKMGKKADLGLICGFVLIKVDSVDLVQFVIFVSKHKPNHQVVTKVTLLPCGRNNIGICHLGARYKQTCFLTVLPMKLSIFYLLSYRFLKIIFINGILLYWSSLCILLNIICVFSSCWDSHLKFIYLNSCMLFHNIITLQLMHPFLLLFSRTVLEWMFCSCLLINMSKRYQQQESVIYFILFIFFLEIYLF